MPFDAVRTCLVTGAAGGIGRALVLAFREAGYRVVASDRAEPPGDLDYDRWVRADLEKFVEDEAYAAEITAQIREALPEGRLNALINNAATQILGGTGNLTRNDWQTTLDVNLMAPFFMTQSLLPELERAYGAVVNISSIHAKLTKAKFVAYATSKAALSGMTRAMAVDLGARVRVNAIEAAAIDTAMLRAGFATDPEGLAELGGYHPSGAIGAPRELAKLCLYLVGSDTPFLHGATIGLDGGISGRLFDPS